MIILKTRMVKQGTSYLIITKNHAKF